jgi:hypothetical protein
MHGVPDLSLQALERLLDLAGESQARQFLAELGRRTAQQQLERLIVQRLAMRMLAERAPRHQIRDRLLSRGFSTRTAYRVIEAALDSRGASCATKGPAMAQQPPTLVASQHPEPNMAAIVEALRKKLSDLQRERAALDLEGARTLAAEAQQAFDAHLARVAELRASDSLSVRREGDTLSLNEHSDLATAARHRRGELEAKTSKASGLSVEIERLSSMLDGEKRVGKAKRELEEAESMVAGAQTKVRDAETALATLETMIATEEAALENGRTEAAARLLAAVKAGADASALPAANRDKLTTLDLARVGALEELDAVRAALSAAQAHCEGKRKTLLKAEAGVTGLAHEIALAAYVETLAAHMKAYGEAHQTPFTLDDPRHKASELAYPGYRWSR